MIKTIWLDLHHSQLTTKQLYEVLRLRNEVFIVEQQCIYQDIDNLDLEGDNHHLLGIKDNQLVAYARILVNATNLSIGRVITSPSSRGKGIGNELLTQALIVCETHWDNHLPIYLSAQAHLQKFYGSFGFIAEGNIYEEDGIPHIKMKKQSY